MAVIQRDKSWEEHLPIIEFAYNRCSHSTTGSSPSQVVYNFNPLMPLDLTPLPYDARSDLDGRAKADMVHELHAKTMRMIEKRNAVVDT